MNKLKKYIAKPSTNPTTLAAELGVTTVTLYNWINGKSKPRIDVAIKLESITKKQVDVYSWI